MDMQLLSPRAANWRRLTCIVAALTVAVIWMSGVPPITSASAAARVASAAKSVIPATISCASLGSVDLSRLDTVIVSVADSTEGGHVFCDVKGYISPQTQFEVLLPETTWRGDYLQQGCGGFCGHLGLSLTDPARTSGYQVPFAPLADGEMVVAADDQGHESPSNSDGLWAKNDPQLRVVFGYSSEHSLAQTTKALIRTFYGRGPAYSYFSGVSDGGHEALDLAERYPTDFNGIIAGAPANNWAPLVGQLEPWLAQVNMNAAGHQILTAEKLPALHAAVMKACADAHGMIRDPRACTFDPASIRCPTGVDNTNCLTLAQVQVVRKEYRGPTDPSGRSLYDGGEPYGSELAWKLWLVMPILDQNAPVDTIAAQLGINYLKYLAFWNNPSESYNLRDVQFTDAMYQHLEILGGIYNATDPDLRAFRAHGGKLIIYHGWADQAIPPFSTVDYYRAVVGYTGGYVASQSFSRLYMIPGLYHCPCGEPVDGDPATSIQFMPQLTHWVENSKAPTAVEIPVTAQTTGLPLKTLTVTPFNPLTPAPKNKGLNSNYNYIGKTSAYQPGNELWCTQQGLTLVCSHHQP
ncbi:MAG: tannase/feruloyl esterase family alpha/beta hydrolase [Ktedonobacteraceae bacterium]